MRAGGVGPIDRAVACVEEAGVDLWRRRPLVAATVAAIGVALSFPALAVVLLSWSAGFIEGLAAADTVRVFLRAEVTDAERAGVQRLLEESPEVATATWISVDRARQQFSEQFPDLADLAGELDGEELAFPESFDVTCPGGAPAASRLAERLREIPAVDEVRHDAAWARRLERLGGALDAARAVVALLALGVTGLGIASVVGLDALSRREELAIMRLVGAPRLHVRVPFVLAGALQGALGGLLALALVTFILVAALGSRLVGVVPSLPDGLPEGLGGALVAGAAVAGAVGSAVSVELVLRRHARLER